MTQTCKEARGFAEAMGAMAEGLRGMEGMSYYRQMFAKASEVIAELCDELSTDDNSNRKTKEKNEGEKEKRDLPPTPPIERKAKEGEEKKGDISIACACAREGDEEPAKPEEHVGKRTLSQARRENKEADKVFETFWTSYPSGRKYDKKTCKEKIRIRYRDAEDKAKFVNEFLGGLDRWIHSREWADGFVCCPEVFINQERWMTIPEPSASAKREKAEAMREQSNAESAAALRKLGL